MFALMFAISYLFVDFLNVTDHSILEKLFAKKILFHI